MRVEKALLIFFVCLGVSFIFYMKVLGATNLPVNVEKDGYCKLNYGEFSRNIKGSNVCISSSQRYEYTDEQFRSLCPKTNFFSPEFNNHCFKESSRHGGIR